MQQQTKAELATQASIDHSVMGAIWGGKKGQAAFRQTIKDLNDG